MENKYTSEDLKIMQGWSLEKKIQVTQTRIMEWYIRHEGKVYISFSGGKDSTVLLDLARRIYPDIEAVFVDTGLEYPEIRDFVKTKENVTWLKPKMTFVQVLEKYGYPVISKEVARDVKTATNKPSGRTYQKFVRGSEYHKKYGDRWLLEKYEYLLKAPFKISNECCNVMKKRPTHSFDKESGKFPIIGTMASESSLRKKNWLNGGCNSFDGKNPSSKPMSFWKEQDVLEYIKRYGIPYCNKIYGDILLENDTLRTEKAQRTGCMFCMFGITSDKAPNRFQRMAITHPKQYDYCINKLGCGEVLDFIGVDYKPVEKDIM